MKNKTVNKQKANKIRTLLYDCETSPVLAWTFRVGHDINIEHSQILDGQKFDIICICYKWLGEDKIHTLTWDPKAQDSSKMIREFTKIVESADLVVGHNGDRFDMRQVNTQRLLHGQPPIDWPTSEDTLKQIKKHFYLPSYKLDYLSKLLAGGGKDKMVLQDWIDIVLKKCPKALAKMTKYCRRDVQLLEDVYKRVIPYCKPKVNAAIIAAVGPGGCPRCGHNGLQGNGRRGTLSGMVQRFRCNNCGSNFAAAIKKNGTIGKLK